MTNQIHEDYETDREWRRDICAMDSWVAGWKWGAFGGFLLGAIVMWFAK